MSVFNTLHNPLHKTRRQKKVGMTSANIAMGGIQSDTMSAHTKI